MLKLLAVVLVLAPAVYSQCSSCNNNNNNGYNSGYGTTYYASNGYSNQQYGNQPCCGSSSYNYNSNTRMYNPNSYNNGYNTQYSNTYGNQYYSNSPTRYYNDLINTNLGYPSGGSNYGSNSYNQNRMYDSTGYGMTGYNSQNGMSGCCSSVSSSCCYQMGTSGNVYYDPNMRSTTASPYGYGSTASYPYTSTYMNNYGKK